MVRHRIIPVAILLTWFLGGVVHANDELQLKLHPGMGGVIDIGVTDCALFTDMHYNGPTGMRHHVLTWLQGYVYAQTGANIEALLQAMPADNGWNFDSLSDIFVDYCSEHPEAHVSEAARELWLMLSEGKSAPH
jgi:hypothetical protein